jgi:hypothetical protein
MVITDVQLPVCDHCGKPPVIEKLLGQPADGKDTHLFFVMCKSDPCARRRDNGQMSAGRPLTNGEPSQHKAEETWKDHARTDTYRSQLAKVRP